MKTALLIALALGAATSLPVRAGTAPASACAQFYANGHIPLIQRPRMAVKTRELCFSAFGVMHSGVTRTPLWSAEYLTPEHIAQAAQLDRQDSFHEEDRLPEAERATLEDYKGSGYDRGHLSPNHDMPDRQAQEESFSLANMIPQAPKVNRGAWAEIEQTVRKQVQAGHSLYVITGPLFEGQKLTQLNQHVLVPTATFKAIYDPQERGAVAYVATNDRQASQISPQTLTLAALEQRLGINLYPRLAKKIKTTAWTLPVSAAARAGNAASAHQP